MGGAAPFEGGDRWEGAAPFEGKGRWEGAAPFEGGDRWEGAAPFEGGDRWEGQPPLKVGADGRGQPALQWLWSTSCLVPAFASWHVAGGKVSGQDRDSLSLASLALQPSAV